jgi:hypothetical protein
MMRPVFLFVLLLSAGTAGGCGKGSGEATTAPARPLGSAGAITGCDHDIESDAVLKHSWPYPADHRNLRWGRHYEPMKLKLKPTHAAFVTATVTWKAGELIEVEDSQVWILKPRRLLSKRDLDVKREVWDQGIRVERTYRAAAKGEVASFLFYNSRGMCLVDTEQGPGWTACTLDDAFEGLSAEHPYACEQVWWVKVRKSRVDRGWMRFDPGLMERVPPPSAAK